MTEGIFPAVVVCAVLRSLFGIGLPVLGSRLIEATPEVGYRALFAVFMAAYGAVLLAG